MIRFFMEANGKLSMVRLLAFIVILAGAFGFIWSITHTYDTGVLVSASVIASSQATKLIQKRLEE